MTVNAAESEDVVVSLGDNPSSDRIDIRARAARPLRAASRR
jgi:hypothetical protein